MRRLLLILPVAAFAVLVAILGLLTLQTQDGRDPSLIPSPLVGKPVPEFTLPAVSDEFPGGFAAANLRDEVIMVNFFASWCVPCLAEHPLITRLAEEGLAVYGVNHRDKTVDAVKWLKKHGNPYTAIGADPEGRVSLDWGVTGLPETFIINAEGIITHKHSGPITPDVLKKTILPKLQEARQ